MYRSAVEGRGRYGYVQTKSPAGLNNPPLPNVGD